MSRRTYADLTNQRPIRRIFNVQISPDNNSKVLTLKEITPEPILHKNIVLQSN
jgi:hypothetical protein